MKIDGKSFMNMQEAVGWLLNNNCIPFQSTANYIANTEIGLGTIINPSPAKVRIGSIIFFADSKVSTVIGITENGFICSDQYNDLVDDIVYISNVQLNASGHLIVTLSNGESIDAGIIKQINNFSINGSQHLIANYNDGTTTDLGAIFNGNVNIAGNFTANSIIENMIGYSYDSSGKDPNVTLSYCGVVKNGNKITFVMAGVIESSSDIPQYTSIGLGVFYVPSIIGSKLYEIGTTTQIDFRKIFLYEDGALNQSDDIFAYITKYSDTTFSFSLRSKNQLDANTKYFFRYEATFLLSDNLAS